MLTGLKLLLNPQRPIKVALTMRSQSRCPTLPVFLAVTRDGAALMASIVINVLYVRLRTV